MDNLKPTLDDLRQEIDEIDTALHDLIMRRAAIVGHVTEAKGPQADSGMRPGREAEILRRLAGRHTGPFPRGAVLRVWREIIASLTAMQGPYAVAVFADGSDGLWDLARDHFGSQTPIAAWTTRREIVAGVARHEVTHGVLPYPPDVDDRPWWAGLWSPDAPRIVLRLPFGEAGNARGAMDALVIARVDPEETGDDRSLAVVETAGEVRRASLADMLGEAGLAGALVCAASDGSSQYLVELDEFVPNDDPRLAGLTGQKIVERVRVVGAYPTPLPDAGAR